VTENPQPPKKGRDVDLNALINTSSAPVPTGIPQRGAEPPAAKPARRPRAERRNDSLSVRIKTSLRDRFEDEAHELNRTHAEHLEHILMAHFGLT